MHPNTLRRLYTMIILEMVCFFLIALLSKGGVLVGHEPLLWVGVFILFGALMAFLILANNVYQWRLAREAFRRFAEHHQAESAFSAFSDCQGNVSFEEEGVGVEISLEVRTVATPWNHGFGGRQQYARLPLLTVALTPAQGLGEDFAIHMHYSPFTRSPKDMAQLRECMKIDRRDAPWLKRWLEVSTDAPWLTLASFRVMSVEVRDRTFIACFSQLPLEAEEAERLVRTCRELCDRLASLQAPDIDARFTLDRSQGEPGDPPPESLEELGAGGAHLLGERR